MLRVGLTRVTGSHENGSEPGAASHALARWWWCVIDMSVSICRWWRQGHVVFIGKCACAVLIFFLTLMRHTLVVR